MILIAVVLLKYFCYVLLEEELYGSLTECIIMDIFVALPHEISNL